MLPATAVSRGTSIRGFLQKRPMTHMVGGGAVVAHDSGSSRRSVMYQRGGQPELFASRCPGGIATRFQFGTYIRFWGDLSGTEKSDRLKSSDLYSLFSRPNLPTMKSLIYKLMLNFFLYN